jgi:hypothetical protein
VKEQPQTILLSPGAEVSHGGVGTRRRRGGRGGRGRGWRSGFFPEYQPPFNPFFFPGYGFDPYMQQGG